MDCGLRKKYIHFPCGKNMNNKTELHGKKCGVAGGLRNCGTQGKKGKGGPGSRKSERSEILSRGTWGDSYSLFYRRWDPQFLKSPASEHFFLCRFR